MAFFYHSNCDEPGIAGIATITRAGYPDPSQFDDKHDYYDEKSTEDEPRWFSFDVKWKRRFKRFVHLADLQGPMISSLTCGWYSGGSGCRFSRSPSRSGRKSVKWEALVRRDALRAQRGAYEEV